MSVIFSRSCEYAIQSVLYLARKGGNRTVLLREISDSLGIPHHFLSKVLQLLSRHGIVVSQKGANGGFALAQPLNTIMLADIVEAVDGDALMTECVLGFPECDSEHPCPAHHTWKEAKAIISTMLHEKTLGELGKEFDRKLSRTMKRKGR
ncbi:MAG TPA: Rrf2 family transcriptional regulator [Bacteroidota bacterium]|nr:Rrf2 family transcriptional regulator [Bacteroidota bacterium]